MEAGGVVLQGALEIAEKYAGMVTLRHVRLNEFVFNQKSANLKAGKGRKGRKLKQHTEHTGQTTRHTQHTEKQTEKLANLKARRAGKTENSDNIQSIHDRQTSQQIPRQ